jgi:predicted RNA-binding Zn-ribbon protein involved in translation (DUF1610 family)
MKSNPAIIPVSKREWDRFLETVEELVNVHIQLLRLVRELKSRETIMKEQLRDALSSKTRQISQSVTSRIDEATQQLTQIESRSTVVGVCANCGRELIERQRYCDHCGGRLEWRLFS